MIKKYIEIITFICLLFLQIGNVYALEDESATYQYNNFEYIVLLDGTIEIKDYVGEEDVIEIPSSINGITVSSLGDHSFSYCKASRVIIPDTVKIINSYAFIFTENLTYLNIPDSVTFIDDSAFRYSGIEEIRLSKNITEIGDRLFQLSCIKKIDIPYGVKKIGYCAFVESPLSEITIPETVTTIEGGAFAWCYNLKSITIPKSVILLEESSGFEDNVFEGIEDQITLNVYTDSAALQYAINHNINYKIIEENILGDANGDGNIDFLDGITILKYDSEMTELDSEQIKAADVNKDEEVNFMDAIQILRYDAELIEGFD